MSLGNVLEYVGGYLPESFTIMVKVFNQSSNNKNRFQ